MYVLNGFNKFVSFVGIPFEVSSRPEGCLRWLEVKEYKQKGSDEWKPADACFMPFEQHGPLLFEQS